jgi:hypothetical protein
LSSNFLSVNPLKSVRFSKTYIYSGRKNVDASSCAKNSISIFFQKIGLLRGPPLTKYMGIRGCSWKEKKCAWGNFFLL